MKGKHYTKKIPVADYTMLKPAVKGDKRSDLTEYQAGVRSTNYTIVLTRPDIAFVQS